MAGLPAVAQAATTHNVTAGSSTWLSTQLTTLQQPNGQGLLSDFILGITATKQAQAAAASATDYLAGVAGSYANAYGAGSWNAGGTAKLLLVAVAQQRDVSSFGGVNLRGGLLATLTTSGADTGRFQDVNNPDGDYSNAFSQTLGILGLSRSGGVPADAVGYLIGQQCPNGGFPLFFVAGGCTDNGDVDYDSTGMAVQALLAPGVAGSTPAATNSVNRAVAFLVGAQQADGSFTDPPWEGSNSNTTGLVAAGLRQAGQTAAVNKAATWLTGLQLNCAAGVGSPANAYLGAIAYNPEVFTTALTSGIAELDVDQWQRATSQAILGLPGASTYVTVSSDGADQAASALSCAPYAPVASTIRFASTGDATVLFDQPAGDAGAAAATALSYRVRAGESSSWGNWRRLDTDADSLTVGRKQTRGDVRRPVVQRVAGRHVAIRSANTWGAAQTQVRFGISSRKVSGNPSCRPPKIRSIRYLADGRARITLTHKAASCVKVRWRINGSQFGGWKKITAGGKRTILTPSLGATGRGTVEVRGGVSLLATKLWAPR